MKEISAQTLEPVVGGTRKSDTLNQTLTQVQSSISSLAQNNNNNGASSTTTMLMLAMAIQNRNQTVVAAAPTTVVAAQPAFSIRARFRF